VICFQGGGRSFTARLIGGEFVSYASRFPAGFACSAEFDAAAFTAAVRRVAVAADRASPVRLAFADGTARIEAETEGRARAAESVAAGFSGPERAIAFSPRYLLDGLEAATAADRGHAAAPGPEAEEPGAPVPSAGGLGVPGCRIRLEFTDAVKPALITLARKQGSGPAAAPQDSPGAVSAPPAGPGGDTDAADFRYLVVPQRLVPRT
jgi:DNA polymerase III sliding clamp (beta) subunit (PCNA family)